MKKLIIAVAAILLSMGAYAQSGFEWGVKAGLNLSKISGVYRDTKFAPGTNLGILGEYVINDLFGVQAEVLFSSQGFRDAYYKSNAQIFYIHVPILAKLYLLKGLSVDMGGLVGYVVSMDNPLYIDHGEYYADLALSAGISYKLNSHLGFYTRYNHSPTKIGEFPGPGYRVIQCGVEFRF